MVVLTSKCKQSITVAKYLVEGSGLLLGIILQGSVGFGTILMILIFGPCIQFWTHHSELLFTRVIK